MNKIGINVSKRRHELNMTQEQLAELSDLSINFISKVERGAATDIKANTLYRLAKSLNVSMESLLIGETNDASICGPFQKQLILKLQKYDLQHSERICRSVLDLLDDQ